jgi:hypothetical protein
MLRKERRTEPNWVSKALFCLILGKAKIETVGALIESEDDLGRKYFVADLTPKNLEGQSVTKENVSFDARSVASCDLQEGDEILVKRGYIWIKRVG